MSLTLFTLVAFAANSILCRIALGSGSIDPASFASIRLISGAMALLMVVRMRKEKKNSSSPGSVIPAAMLCLYAVSFSFAYVSLSVGTGALILFGAVQATMIGAGIFHGERMRVLAWLGLLVAIAGLTYLVLPGIQAPPLKGTLLMLAAGIAWGIYSLKGLNVTQPIPVTAANFLWSLPAAICISLITVSQLHVTFTGAVFAILSGALFSGIGYVAWYAALPYFSSARAAAIQLLVPVIAAFGGVLLLSEPVTLRMLISGALIIGGVWMTLFFKQKSSATHTPETAATAQAAEK